MKHVVVYGPAACGKTRNKSKLAKAFGCQNIVDGVSLPELKQSLERSAVKTLYLTNDVHHRHGIESRRCEIVEFHDAMRAAGLRA